MRNIKRFSVFPVWFYILFNPFSVYSQSPNDVIINEVLNGTSFKDAVELLVVKPGGVDMRGWTITDLNNSGATPSTTEGYCSFPANPFLQNVPQFTRIVLVFTKSTGSPSPIAAQDTVAAGDSTLVLFSFGADSLLNPAPAGSGVNLGSNDNLALIAGSNLASDPVVDKLNYGTSTDTWTGSVWVNNIADITGGSIAYFVNDSAGSLINDNGASGKGWTSGIAETNHSLGLVNPGQLLGGKPIRLGSVSRTPQKPDSTQSVTVSTKIGFMNPPIAAYVMFTINSVTDSITMTNPSDSTYQGIISPKSPGTKVLYYVKVSDNSGNVSVTSVDSFTVSFPVDLTPIASIQANSALYDSQTVTVAGIVVFGDYKLINTRRTVYVVDRSSGVNGLQIFSNSLIAGDTLKRGDSVIVRGMILEYQGTTEITHPVGGTMDISVVSRGNPLPAPNNRTVLQASDVGREGEWVRVLGNVNSVSSLIGGGYNVVIEDGSGSTTVRIWQTTGVNMSKIVTGNAYSFKCIIGLYSGATQLLFAYDDDLTQDSAGHGKIALKVSPYPFNPMAGEMLKYAIRCEQDSRIIVRLYDVSGRLVTTLMDEVKVGGLDETSDPLKYRIWNGRMKETRQLVPVGTYLMHLEVTNRKTGKSSYKTAPIVIGTKLK